jgi:hypothetical protein
MDYIIINGQVIKVDTDIEAIEDEYLDPEEIRDLNDIFGV